MGAVLENGTQADFFVHPDYHRLRWHPMDAEVHRYEDVLRDKVEASTLPVLIYDATAEGRGEFWDLFPSEQRFLSKPWQGYLAEDGSVAQRFNGFLAEREVLRGIVHGSYLEACVGHFKRSLRTLGKNGILHALSSDEAEAIEGIAEPQVVKYGIVLSSRSKSRGFYPEFMDLESGLPPRYYAGDAQIFRATQL